ncbi:MAG TPA: hypothetical protein VKA30_00395 [Actinomycetota bacterium]|nr:hypothetical protein [Actinomycetota bacterium]
MVCIAYQVLGDGPVDLVYVPTLTSHLEHGEGPDGRVGTEVSGRGMHTLKGIPDEWRVFEALA